MRANGIGLLSVTVVLAVLLAIVACTRQPAAPLVATDAAALGPAALSTGNPLIEAPEGLLAAEPTPASTPTPLAKAPSFAKLKLAGSTIDVRRELAGDFWAGEVKGIDWPEGERAVRLAETRKGVYVASGEIVSAPYEPALPFDNLLLSWNGSAPAGTSLTFHTRVRTDLGWSQWGKTATWAYEGRKTSEGGAAVSMLGAKGKALAWQYRVVLATDDLAKTPRLGSVSLVAADRSQPLAGPAIRLLDGWKRELPVSVESQLLQERSVAYQICSPTSLTMVLRYWGVNTSVRAVYQAVQDARPIATPFGNWPLNMAHAGEHGLDSYVTRLYSLDQVKNEIAEGRPVPISIAYKEGELPGAAVSKTAGHFVVVRGFTAQGDVIINDPMGASLSDVRRVVKAADLAKAWLGHGGVAYMVRPLS